MVAGQCPSSLVFVGRSRRPDSRTFSAVSDPGAFRYRGFNRSTKAVPSAAPFPPPGPGGLDRHEYPCMGIASCPSLIATAAAGSESLPDCDNPEPVYLLTLDASHSTSPLKALCDERRWLRGDRRLRCDERRGTIQLQALVAKAQAAGSGLQPDPAVDGRRGCAVFAALPCARIAICRCSDFPGGLSYSRTRFRSLFGFSLPCSCRIRCMTSSRAAIRRWVFLGSYYSLAPVTRPLHC
jgi:hypothetical protein